jgi:hypothetical protein
MTDRNPWLTPGNGVLGALLDPSDPWAQMVHEIWQRRLREQAAQSEPASSDDPPSFVDASRGNASGLPSPASVAAETPSVSLPTPLLAASMRPRSPSPLPFELESWLPPARTSDRDAGPARTVSWQTPPLLDQGPIWGSLFPASEQSLPVAGPAPARDQSNAVPGPGGLWGMGLRVFTDGTKPYRDGRRLLIENPELRLLYDFSHSAWTGQGGPTRGTLDLLRRYNIPMDPDIKPAPPGSIGRNAGIRQAIANNENGRLAEEAAANRWRAKGYIVERPVPDDGSGRRADFNVRHPNRNPTKKAITRSEVKSGRVKLGKPIRRQVERDAAARDANAAERAKGEVLQAEGRLVRNLGRAPGAVGLGLDGLELFSAYGADGNRIGENTERAATGIAGGAAGGWGGAAAGGVGGAAIARKWKAPRGRLGLLGALVGGILGAIGGDPSARAIYDHVRRPD